MRVITLHNQLLLTPPVFGVNQNRGISPFVIFMAYAIPSPSLPRCTVMPAVRLYNF